MAAEERAMFNTAGKRHKPPPTPFCLTAEGSLFWLCGGAPAHCQAPTPTPQPLDMAGHPHSKGRGWLHFWELIQEEL